MIPLTELIKVEELLRLVLFHMSRQRKNDLVLIAGQLVLHVFLKFAVSREAGQRTEAKVVILRNSWVIAPLGRVFHLGNARAPCFYDGPTTSNPCSVKRFSPIE